MSDAILYALTADVVKRVDVDLHDLDALVDMQNAFRLFKNIQKKSNLKSKSYLLVWEGNLYYIVKSGKEYKIYQLDTEYVSGELND